MSNWRRNCFFLRIARLWLAININIPFRTFYIYNRHYKISLQVILQYCFSDNNTFAVVQQHLFVTCTYYILSSTNWTYFWTVVMLSKKFYKGQWSQGCWLVGTNISCRGKIQKQNSSIDVIARRIPRAIKLFEISTPASCSFWKFLLDGL